MTILKENHFVKSQCALRNVPRKCYLCIFFFDTPKFNIFFPSAIYLVVDEGKREKLKEFKS